jgi:hypothetical protein
MKKIKNLVECYGWVMMLSIIFLWIFWAGQLYSPLKQDFSEYMHKMQNRDIVVEKREAAKAYALFSEKLEKAKAKGTKYGPRDYFADLKSSYEIGGGEIFYPNYLILSMQGISTENVREGYFTENDINSARQEFKEWLQYGRYDKGRKALDQKIVSNLKLIGLKNWLLIFYFRSIFLALLLYSLKMLSRKGILETILADKKKFLLAIVAWPLYIFRYPNNVVREIIVEAEMRRLGNLFRKFTSREKELVKNVANSVIYKNWLTTFQANNAEKFVRKLPVAIFATLLIVTLGLFVKNQASAEESSHGRSPAQATFSVAYSSNSQGVITVRTTHDEGSPFLIMWVTVNANVARALPLIGKIEEMAKVFFKNRAWHKIEHIPIFSDYLGKISLAVA